MRRTLNLIVGLFFAILFFGYLISTVVKKVEDSDGFEVLSLRIENGTDWIEVVWTTSAETMGTVFYLSEGREKFRRDEGFSTNHKVTISRLNSSTQFWLESCDLLGNCIESERWNGSFSAVFCPDSTQNHACSDTLPKYCIDGILEDSCMKCGCPSGSRCITSGICE